MASTSTAKNGFESVYEFHNGEDASEFFLLLQSIGHRSMGTVLPPRDETVKVTSDGPSVVKMKKIGTIKRHFVDVAGRHGKKETPFRISDWTRKQIKDAVLFYARMKYKITPVADAHTFGFSHPHNAQNLQSQYIVFTKFVPYEDEESHWNSLVKVINELKQYLDLQKLSVAEFDALLAMLKSEAGPADIYNLPIFFSAEDREAYILRLYGFMKMNKNKLFWHLDLGRCFPNFIENCRNCQQLCALTTKINGDLEKHGKVTLTPKPRVSAAVKASNQELFDHVNIMRQSYVHANSFIISTSCMDPFSPELLFGMLFPDHVQLLWAKHPV